MILFESDYKRFPNTIIDVETTNESWVRLAAVYKSMGIKNCYFHLTLLNPELQGVDPFDPNLTETQKGAILTEVSYNPWYFFREIVRLPNGSNPLQFKANRGIIAMIWCFLVAIDSALIMPRQFGKSVGADCLNIWLMFFVYEKTETFLFTKDAELRKRNIQRLKDIRDGLPNYLNSSTGKDTDNTESFTCLARENILRTAVGQSQKARAENIGRGLTMPAAQIDEGPHIVNAHLSIPVLLAATSRARENAEEAGQLYGNFFTTTAGKLDTPEGAYMYGMIHSGMYWTERIFDCKDRLEAHEMVHTNSSGEGTLANITLNHRQLGRSDEAMAKVIASMHADQETINRDLLNIWSSGSMSSPISAELNSTICGSKEDPNHIDLSAEKYMTKWYLSPEEIKLRMETHSIIVGLDTSQAVGKDANSMIYIDTTDMAVIGTSQIREANLNKYGLWIARLLMRHENLTLIPENKISGQAVIDTISTVLMANNINPFKRIYNKIADESIDMSSEYSVVNQKTVTDEIYVTFKKYLGFQTSGSTRPFLYGQVFHEAVNSTGHLIKDNDLATELNGLIVKNGRVDHPPGGNDDSVIAWLLTHWMVRYSKNLSFYGIDSGRVLSLVNSDGAILTPEEIEDKRQLIVLNEHIADIKETLLSAPSVLARMRNEKVLKELVLKAQALGETTYTIDHMLNEINGNRTTKNDLRSSIRKLENRRRIGSMY